MARAALVASVVIAVIVTAAGLAACGVERDRPATAADGVSTATTARTARTAPPSSLPAGAAVVTKVVDGDTIRVRLAERSGIADDEERVRLIGIDTPETHGRGGLRECFGKEATARTAALLPPGTQVRLERDADLRDRYGRLLAYVYRSSDDLFVNLTLAREGFAAVLTVPPNVAHEDELVAAAAAAREGDRGLWGRCGGPDVAVDSPP